MHLEGTTSTGIVALLTSRLSRGDLWHTGICVFLPSGTKTGVMSMNCRCLPLPGSTRAIPSDGWSLKVENLHFAMYLKYTSKGCGEGAGATEPDTSQIDFTRHKTLRLQLLWHRCHGVGRKTPSDRPSVFSPLVTALSLGSSALVEAGCWFIRRPDLHLEVVGLRVSCKFHRASFSAQGI